MKTMKQVIEEGYVPAVTPTSSTQGRVLLIGFIVETVNRR